MPEAEERLSKLETLLRLEQKLLDALRKIDYMLRRPVPDDVRYELLAQREEVRRELDKTRLQINDLLEERGDIDPPSDDLIEEIGAQTEALDSQTANSEQAGKAIEIAGNVVGLAEKVMGKSG